jgi:spermidine/putrescine-binding protein
MAGTVAAAVLPGSRVLAQSSPSPSRSSPSATPVPPGQLRLLTSPDHWDPGVIRTLEADQGIDVKVTALVDDARAYRSIVDGTVAPDLVTADGGWVTRYRVDDRIAPLDPTRVTVLAELYPMARTLDIVSSEDGMLGLPWSWSPLQVVCDPARLTSIPDSWDVLIDPSARRRVVIEAQAMDLVLCAAKAIGAADPLAMTDAELASATDWMTRLRPNIRKIVDRRSEAIELLASGECTLAISSLGAPDLVKDAGGPDMLGYVPREGTIGSIEVDCALRGAPDAVRIPAWLDAAATAQVAAQAFLTDGRPLFNERAYQLLVDSGHGDRARRYLYDRPETCLDMTLTGPGERLDDYLAVYASVFGEAS